MIRSCSEVKQPFVCGILYRSMSSSVFTSRSFYRFPKLPAFRTLSRFLLWLLGSQFKDLVRPSGWL